jgi:hypothetical protein
MRQRNTHTRGFRTNPEQKALLERRRHKGKVTLQQITKKYNGRA